CWEVASWQPVGFLKAPNRAAQPPGQPCARALAFAPDGRTLATGHADSTILLWDLTLRSGPRSGPLTPAQRDAAWNDLAGSDAARAYAAVWRFVDDPESALSLLQERLRPVPPPPVATVRALLDDLDSDQFAVREAAAQKLRALGEQAGAPLQAALK